MEEKKKFDQKDYINKYNKENYKHISFRLRSELADKFKKFCEENNLSYPEYIEKTLKLISEDNIKISKIKEVK